MPELKPAYLIAGTDEGKIGAVLARLRARAEREGGPGALEAFGGAPGQGPADADALVAAIPAMSLIASRRYLLADGVERWTAKQVASVVAALGELPPETTVVLVAREEPPRRRAPKGLADAVRAAGGEMISYQEPRVRELPRRLVADAEARGFRLEREAATLLVERMGARTARLANELDRLALWAGPDGEVTAADLEAMIVDTSEAAVWTLADAIVERRPDAAQVAAERLAGQGENLSHVVYGVAGRLRLAHRAAAALERGRSSKEITASLGLRPYAAKMLLERARSASADELRAATSAIADLEYWTRGGADYPERAALTLAVLRAAGGAP